MIKSIYKSDGYIYENEIPCCEYCGKSADLQGVVIFETPHSGILICDSTSCALQYMCQEIKTNEFEKVDYIGCDECEEKIENGLVDSMGGRQLCIDCESEIVIDKIKKNGYI